jgi:hypothetical protein
MPSAQQTHILADALFAAPLGLGLGNARHKYQLGREQHLLEPDAVYHGLLQKFRRSKKTGSAVLTIPVLEGIRELCVESGIRRQNGLFV